jgi:hypothetical protein
MEKSEMAGRVREAARLLTVSGHCKGRSYGDAGTRCMGGALSNAGLLGTSSVVDQMITTEILAVLHEQYPGRVWDCGCGMHESYVIFNDDPETTAADVITVLEKTAARLEEGS